MGRCCAPFPSRRDSWLFHFPDRLPATVSSMIPRIIHQTWKTEAIPPQWQAAQQSWRDAHPEWEYRFWTDEDLERLVRERAPQLVPLFQRYPDQIQRVDAARYVILYEHGGLYADLDMECVRPLDDLLDADLVLPRTTPLGLSNQLMLTRPGHPFLKEALEALPGSFERWQRWWLPRHFRILLTTGPLFVTGRVRAHGEDAGIRILSLAEHGHGDPEQSYVRHLRGKTWAGWDTYLFNFLHDNWRWLTAAALLVVLASVLLQ